MTRRATDSLATRAGRRICIVIPAFNEATSIGTVVRGLSEAFPEIELVVVDDGSSDSTGELAAAENCRVIRHEQNRGYGASIRTGVLATDADVVVCFDADGQHNAGDLPRLLEALAEGADMAVGARTSDSHKALSRQPGKMVLAAVANFILGAKIPDLNSGFRAFRRDVLLKYMHLMPSGFSFSTTSTFAFYKSNRIIRWIPITTGKRVGKSTVSQLRDGFGSLLLMVRLVTLFEPLKIFLPASAALAVAGVGSALYDVAYNQEGLADTTILLLISTLLVFFFGLICDQISAIRREIHE